MADYGIPVEDVNKYQKWTGYFLVDIKIIFIITYVYISVVNLISTTANNEANRDVQGSMGINVTARPGDTDVIVNYIDDSVLWNCRERSLTSDYYVILYWMLLSVFMGTLVPGFMLFQNSLLCGALLALIHSLIYGTWGL